LIQRSIPEELKKNLGFYFSTIKRNTSQLYTLVEDFSKYTSLSKEEVIDTSEADLNVTAQSLTDNFQEILEEKKGQIIIHDLPTIKTSPSMLYIALKHLVDNGLKYNSSDTPTVEIAYQSTVDKHQIIVSDNGIGIDEQYHERIFEMFKRLHDRSAYKGTGIGLAIVKLMVEKLNGEIQLESKVGVGSRFIIELPKE
jgi:light-regulated signal transduction histidine kinase (bacteriophytochrome)